MFRTLKLVHFAGLVMFLGSIISFIAISSLIEDTGLQNLVFGREIISAGTYALTIPGMWILAVSGIWMGILKFGIRRRYFQIKLVLIALMIINAYFFVLPAVNLATELAEQSLVRDRLLAQYESAYLRESIFGAANVLLIIAAASVGIWKIGGKK